MIKEKVKRKPEITFIQELKGYIRTAGITFLSAVIFTVLLSFHARSEMIKNLYAQTVDKTKIEKEIAQQIVNHADLLSSLNDKNYAVCYRVGNLYEAVGDLQKAEYAYYLAVQKSLGGVYNAHLKYATNLITQGKTKDAEDALNSVKDTNSLRLIRYKTRAYIILGDKYFSEGKFLKASGAYEKADYYYHRLKKRDRIVHESIRNRIINSFVETASVIVQKGGSSFDAVRFLKKALAYDPDNLNIQYRLTLLYADLDPLLAVDNFEKLMQKIPQNIDFLAFEKSLMKAANMMDIENNSIKAKYYRYKIYSYNLFIKNKVVYKDDCEIELKSLKVKKFFFKYQLRMTYNIKNVTNENIKNLHAEFVLRKDDKIKQIIVKQCATKASPLIAYGAESKNIDVIMGKNIFTKRELQRYTIDVYLYKDPKFKTLVYSHNIPTKRSYLSRTRVSPHL